MKKILLLLLLPFTFFLHADDNDSTCQQLLNLESELNKTLPRKIDEATEVTQLSVNCETTTIKYTKRLLVEKTNLAEGWKNRKQRQHTQLHCNANGLSSVSGWTAMDVIYDSNFEYITTFLTEPNDCD